MKALILNLTDDRIDCDRLNIREQIENIFDDPDIIQFKTFTDVDSMLNLIYSALGSKKVGVTACNIWECKNYLYAGYFIDMTELIDQEDVHNDNEEILLQNVMDAQKKIKLNMFGSQITSQHVASNLVIIKQQLTYEISNNNIKTNTKSIGIGSTREMIDIFEALFVKDGIVIKYDGSLHTFNYIMNPLEHQMLTDSNYAENYIYHEYEVYNHIMMIIVDVREVNGSLNETATLLAGKPIKGTAFVAIYRKPEYNENPPYISMSMDRLNNIMNIRQRSASLTTGFSHATNEYVNFDKLLELEMKKHADKQIQIATEIQGELLNVK